MALVLSSELDGFVQRLVAALDPQEVVLFGSRVRGTARPDSDADLLVVCREDGVPHGDRASHAAVAVSVDRPGSLHAHVFPYTPAEIEVHLAAGDTAVRDALAEGARLYPGDGGRSRYTGWAGRWRRVGAVEQHLTYAREDLADAETLMGGARPVWRNIAFHAQQAAGKALKGLVFHLGGEPERTHDLTALLVAVGRLDPALGRRLSLRHQNELARMTGYAVTTRYPGETGVGEAKARAAVAAARSLVEDVAAAVGEAGQAVGGESGPPPGVG